MQQTTTSQIGELLRYLREVAPERALTYGESMQLARTQARRLRRWLQASAPDFNLIWLVEQDQVPVHFVPSHRLGEESGLTTNAVGGRVQIFINQNEPAVRQRFSLLHEFKHVLDFEQADTLHAKLGRGDASVRANMIEWIANEFAGQTLMPGPLVKQVWRSTTDLRTAATIFNVSVEAMATRLERLNLIGERPPRPRGYFRTIGPSIESEQLAA
jgi:hypothetical protein